MKVKDLLTVDCDFDMTDDYTGESWIAFCDVKLTPAGIRHYAAALALPICEINNSAVMVHVENDKQEHALVRFTLDAAGYGDPDEYDRFFK